MLPIRLMTLDPGHFHAALIQKETIEGVSELTHVYAPLGPDLTAHLNRIASFNLRRENPTRWTSRIYAGPDFLDRMLDEHPGNVAVLSGRNLGKIEAITRALERGIHILGDKPWIVEAADLPKLEAALALARQRGLAAFDAMTQRFEITCILQRELVNDRDVFGEAQAVRMESMHYLLKLVAGLPNLRPPWFFDIAQQGEGLTDVGTHLVDLVQWILSPGQAIRYRDEVEVTAGRRWPTVLTPEQFERVTGTKRGGTLDYFCNNSVDYRLRGVPVSLTIRWDFEAAAGAGDTEFAAFRGSRSTVEVRQGAEEKFRPEVFIIPARGELRAPVRTALERKLAAIEEHGIGIADVPDGFRLDIPERYRIGHEAHFGLLARQFLAYVRNPASMPAWEEPNMLAKYFVTTKGVDLARHSR